MTRANKDQDRGKPEHPPRANLLCKPSSLAQLFANNSSAPIDAEIRHASSCGLELIRNGHKAMGDLLTPVQTTRKVKSSVERFETLLAKDGARSPIDVIEASSTSRTGESKHYRHKKQDSTPFLQQIYLQSDGSSETLPDDAREILKSQADHEDVFAVLQYLQFGIEGKHDFNIRASGPKASQILNVLVTVTIPDRWASLNTKPVSREDKEVKSMLVSCLTCVAGLGALHAQIKKLTGLAISTKTGESLMLKDAVEVLTHVLYPSSFIETILCDTLNLHPKTAQQYVLWQELSSFVAGGKILSSVAQAFPLAEPLNGKDSAEWLANGNQYTVWLARNICHAATKIAAAEGRAWPMLAQLLKRGLSLGHSDAFVTEIYSSLLLGTRALWTPLHLLIKGLPRLDQRSFFYTLLRSVSTRYLNSDGDMDSEISAYANTSIRGVAALIAGVVKDNLYLEECLIMWLTDTNGDASMFPLGARRAAMAVLAADEDKLQAVLDKSMQLFRDNLQIQHASILQQEATAQVILLAVGYLYRLKSERISKLSRSSQYLQAVSNRLGASLPRARYLGMIVGTAISKLVDTPDKAMKFDMTEMESDDARKLLDLIHVDDRTGSVGDLKADLTTTNPASNNTLERTRQKKAEGRKEAIVKHTSKIISIEEVTDDEESDGGLTPYQKPDDDTSDSDEDPTLINRSKPKAPVYISELVKALQTSDKPDTIELALKTAPVLIRRKTGFGTELLENINDLASTLINLQEGMSKEAGQTLRLRSLIACLVAQPAKMGPRFASMYFEGDFSLAQRASLLTTIGLGARELAGYNDDSKLGTDKQQSSFPSQRLPKNLAAIYAPVNHLAKQLEHNALQPMALAAADKLTGPDVLKVRTFSSRLSVEKKTAQKAKERQTRIPKDIHKLLTESIYLPLCCRMSLLLSSRPNTYATTLFEPHILRLFLQTLTILLTTLGPHALQLYTITRETLLLLTGLHVVTKLSTDAVVLPALLQLLFTLLDLNVAAGTVAEEHLVTEFGNMVSELVAWAGNLSNVVNVPEMGREDGGMPWTVLVAGVQVKWHEVGKKFQGRIIGLVGADLDEFGS